MLQGEGPLSLHHRHHISVTINTHTILELQTKNNFSQLFFTLNMHFYHSQQNSDTIHIYIFPLSSKKDPLQISKATGTTHANFLSTVSVRFQSAKYVPTHYVKYISSS